MAEGQKDQNAPATTTKKNFLQGLLARFPSLGPGAKFATQTVFIGIFSSIFIPIFMSSYKSRELHSEFFYTQRNSGAQAILGNYVDLFNSYYLIIHKPSRDSGAELSNAAHEFRKTCNRYLMYFPKNFENTAVGVYYFYMSLSKQIAIVDPTGQRDAAIIYVDACWEDEFRQLFEMPDLAMAFLHPWRTIDEMAEGKSELPDYHLVKTDSKRPFEDYYDLILAEMNKHKK